MDKELVNIILEYLRETRQSPLLLPMLVSEYEKEQDFVEQDGKFIMTTGNSYDEVHEWLKNRKQ